MFYKLNDSFVIKNIDDVQYIENVNTHTFYMCEGVGKNIINMVVSGVSICDIEGRICEIYGEQAISDVKEFLQDLIDEQIIIHKD